MQASSNTCLRRDNSAGLNIPARLDKISIGILPSRTRKGKTARMRHGRGWAIGAMCNIAHEKQKFFDYCDPPFAMERGGNGVGTKKPKSNKLEPLDGLALLSKLDGGRTGHKIAPGETVFRQGDPADAVFYIVAGEIQLKVVSEQGKERMIAVLGPKDFFGEGCLAGQPLNIASATTATETDLIRVQKSTMMRMLRDDREFSEMFTTFLLSRNVRIEDDLIDQLFNSSEKRLARILLLLANLGKDGKMEAIPKISQEVLAARVGTTRSRINHFMNKFRDRGLIEYNGELRVHSSLINIIINE